MKIREIVAAIENIAPPVYADEWDNVGLILGDMDTETDSALIAFEMTEEVLEEAIKDGFGLIITHHPLIFKGIKKINSNNATGRIIQKALQNNVAIYAAHTNLDNVLKGVNGKLAEMLGIKQVAPLDFKQHLLLKLVTFVPESHADTVREALFAAGAGHIGNYDSCSFSVPGKGSFRGDEHTNPFVGESGKLHFEEEARIETILPAHLQHRVLTALIKAHPYEEPAYDFYKLENPLSSVGSGMIGYLEDEMDEMEFLHHIKHSLNIPVLRHSELTGKKIRRVAFCGGAGAFLLPVALSRGADAFITGDVKYHEFFMPEKNLLLVDAGHYETEQFTTSLLFDLLMQKFSNFAIRISACSTNAVNYLI